AEVALELTDRVRRLAAGHVDRDTLWFAVEGGGIALLCGEEGVHVELDLADRRAPGRVGVGARVADRARRAGARRLEGTADVGAGVVILLLRREDEQGVRGGDAVCSKALEEGRERRVVGSEVGLVARVAWPQGVPGRGAPRLPGRAAVRELLVVGVGDVRVRDRNAGLLHVGDVREGLRGGRAEAGEARIELRSAG